MDKGKVIFQKHISREDVRRNRFKIYVFGDNLAHKGYGGQAKEMRGEYNTIGIPTKHSPKLYFNDNDFNLVVPIIKTCFGIIEGHLQCGHTVVLPSDGIGTGLARLPEKAPRIWKLLKIYLKELGWEEKR